MERGENGGFPEPLAGEPIRVVRCEHAECGTPTRVRLPWELPATAVRRVVCDGCSEPFECDEVLDGGVIAARSRFRLPRPPIPEWLSNPESHAWRYLSVPIAAAVVVGALVLIQGPGEPARHSASSAASAAPGPATGDGEKAARAGAEASGAGAATANSARLVNGSSFTLALPPGWARTNSQGGATFTAASGDGGADATLWVRREPKLDFPSFEAQSLAQLHDLAGSARVIGRLTAPTAEGTVVTLAADSPPDQPAYEVTLRVAGPYRYYLATTVEPDASREAVDGAELIHNSLVPVAGANAG